MTSYRGVKRAADALAAAVEHLGVDHGGTHVLVTEKLMDGPDVVARLQQMNGQGMPEGVAPHMLDGAYATLRHYASVPESK